MTAVAGRIGDDMSRRLAGRLYVVVAGRTAATHFVVLEARHGTKGDGGMAGIAAFGAEYVRCRFCRGGDARAGGMTGGAGARRGLEYPVDVAGLAAHVAVCTG